MDLENTGRADDFGQIYIYIYTPAGHPIPLGSAGEEFSVATAMQAWAKFCLVLLAVPDEKIPYNFLAPDPSQETTPNQCKSVHSRSTVCQHLPRINSGVPPDLALKY